jgi:hypothetical protein
MVSLDINRHGYHDCSLRILKFPKLGLIHSVILVPSNKVLFFLFMLEELSSSNSDYYFSAKFWKYTQQEMHAKISILASK